MNFLILNESSKKALVRSRRVLSKFLPQLGSSTWAGSLSEEGLEDLKSALKAAGVSKNTAISCLQVVGRGRLEPRWLLGSRAPFDYSGRYAFRETQAQKEAQAPRPRSPAERLFEAILKLSALAHDTGKASAAFQAKLRKGAGAEAIRHELLSFLIVFQSLREGCISDEEWLVRLRDCPEEMAACVTDKQMLPADSLNLSRIKDAIASKERRRASREGEDACDVEVMQSLLTESEVQTLLSETPLLGAFFWLVLTHHRLPDSDRTAQSWWAGQYVHVPSEELPVSIASLDSCLVPAQGTPPWRDSGWLKAVSSAAGAAVSALEELSQVSGASLKEAPSTLALLCAHYLRPGLILADHLGSQRAPKSLSKSDRASKEVIFANTREDHFGDTLTAHQLAVGRLTRKVLRLFETPLPATSLPPRSLSVIRPLPAPFDWQMHLEDACRAAASKGPVFTSVIAETGAGKTLGGLRAAHALSGGRIRLTLALGLRSLTQQSAEAMVKDAELPADSLVVAVGNPQTLRLADRFKEAQARRFGSDSAEGEDCALSVRTQAEPDLNWLDGFCTEKEAPDLWGLKTLSMLAAPVLACTTDHLVASATMLKGGDAKMYLRLATSDLLLDEIDSYGAEDLQSLGKLCLIAGLHHRNVTLMSATLSPAVRNGLYAAWCRGLEVRSALKGTSRAHACVMSSNTVPSELAVSEGSQLDDGVWERYVQKVVDVYEATVKTAPRRKASLVELDQQGSKTHAFDTIIEAARKLHEVHHTVDAATGKRVSIGFVRLNTAKNAWQLAKHLAAYQGAGFDTRFVAYHSKFPRTYLGVLDATLQQLTSRKHPTAFLATPCLRAALDQAATQDLMVLVCTTTLIETGRDFDFDWCVLEPRSVRGEVQASGRVWRHRRHLVASVSNVAVLSHPLKTLESSGNVYRPAALPESVWGRPGVEDELKGLRVTRDIPSVLGPTVAPTESTPPTSVRLSARLRRGAVASASAPGSSYIETAAEALPSDQWQRGIHAGPCLLAPGSYAENRIGFLEHSMHKLHLQGALKWDKQSGRPPSLTMYLHTLAAFNRTHSAETPFRGHREQQLIFIPHKGKVTYFDALDFELRKGVFRRTANAAVVLEIPKDKALLPDLESQADTLFTGTDAQIDGCSLRCTPHKGADKELQWHPLLGFHE